MNALSAALNAVDDVAAEGDLKASARESDGLELEPVGDPVELPDGRRIYPPALFGRPIHEIACELLDHDDPSRSRFLRLVGPPGTGKSQVARLIAHHRWTAAGRDVELRDGRPFYGLVELQPGPSSDEYFFRYDYVPVPDSDRVQLVDAAFVEAMRNGWLVVIDEVNLARDVALLSINATLDGRLTLHLPATNETVIAQPGFGVLLAYNPGLVGASDIPDAWRSRFPAAVEVTSNWPALLQMGAPERLVQAARDLDQERFAGDSGLVWTPQFRDIEALWDMAERVGERWAIALWMSNVQEQVETGNLQPAEASAVARMLDEAGYGRYRVSESGGVANLNGYPRAVTR
ncbi:AAA family ATPase [Conexibacter sp. CPCC 206217]|uniref:AAA family ATPase n=1 Tax=Conexibacter sp. CPCC 206217 TaxID=3064574 RepID=UPI00271B7A06|nr:AAA family ATPase [Conexibacter sp. CPCC 206217]MDO8208970.1 AAA family ATPase [Conexibacter sp. CPCC 206217]